MTELSVQVHLRRIILEDAYVAVPITRDMVKQDPDGNNQIDVDMMLAQALSTGERLEVEWAVESTQTTVHPTQCTQPAHRQVFNPYVAGEFDKSELANIDLKFQQDNDA